MAAWVVWQLCHYFLGEARRRDQPGSRLRDGLEWSGGQVGVQSQRAGSAAGPPCRLPTPLLRWNLPGVIFAREQESRPPLSSAHSPGPTHSGLAPACQEGEARKRRDQKRGSRPAALLGGRGPSRNLKRTRSWQGSLAWRGQGGTGSPSSGQPLLFDTWISRTTNNKKAEAQTAAGCQQSGAPFTVRRGAHGTAVGQGRGI